MRRIGEERIDIASQSQNSAKPRLFKFVVGAFLALFVFISAVIFWRAYGIWKIQNQAKQMVQSWENYQNKQYQLALADTYGGKTPQETLQMYIDAVQKGDYELASKYFTLNNQTKELESFKNAPKENIDQYLLYLRQAMAGEGGYSFDNKYFSWDKPISVQMMLYPSGIWKIVEI